MTETVDAPAGAMRGQRLEGGVTVFAGLPFAAAPVGPLRFRPPQPALRWAGVPDATSHGPRPAQLTTGDAESSPVGSEDCLHLNVWVPDGEGTKPVVVWIYGGGFENGSGAPPDTNGEALARHLDAIVVAPNYRVGALGFAHLSDLGGTDWAGCSNVGLQDQVAALRWVQQNIAAFGGDPDRVCVAGESAGAFSIGSLLAMPSAVETFRRAILQSGSTSRVFDPSVAAAMATDLLATLGVDDLEQLSTVPVAKILSAQREVIDTDIGRRNLPGGRSWGVVLDGAIVPVDPQAAVASGYASGIDLLIGTNRDEVQLFEVLQGDAYRPASVGALSNEFARGGVADPDQLLAFYRNLAPGADLTRLRTLFLTDAIYRLPALRLARAHRNTGGRCFMSLFSAEPLGADYGACHAAELSYLFDALADLGADTPANAAIADAFAAAWRSFVHTGDPGWPAYHSSATGNTRQFGGSSGMVTQPLPGLLAAWSGR